MKTRPATPAPYRLRKCTAEPVIGIIKAVLGFRQFSLRGLDAADGEWAFLFGLQPEAQAYTDLSLTAPSAR